MIRQLLDGITQAAGLHVQPLDVLRAFITEAKYNVAKTDKISIELRWTPANKTNAEIPPDIMTIGIK